MLNPTAIINTAIEIARLTTNIMQLINSQADESVIQTHFATIGKIAAANSAKPEIQGYSEHG